MQCHSQARLRPSTTKFFASKSLVDWLVVAPKICEVNQPTLPNIGEHERMCNKPPTSSYYCWLLIYIINHLTTIIPQWSMSSLKNSRFQLTKSLSVAIPSLEPGAAAGQLPHRGDHVVMASANVNLWGPQMKSFRTLQGRVFLGGVAELLKIRPQLSSKPK